MFNKSVEGIGTKGIRLLSKVDCIGSPARDGLKLRGERYLGP